MTRRFVLVTGDFVKTGGQDLANYALALHLANLSDTEVHLVGHRAADDLVAFPSVTFHRVPKPLNSYLLAQPLLNRTGQRIAKQVGGRTIVNGGNCDFADVNWVHYVHAAYRPESKAGLIKDLRRGFFHRQALRDEKRVIPKSRLVLTNSEMTRRHTIELLNTDSTKVYTVYLGCDPTAFCPPTAEERARVRDEMGWHTGVAVGFVGALGDRRKGFDTVFAAWETLCRNSSWDGILVVIGQGAELAAWKARAAKKGLAGRVQFLGFRNDVPRLLKGLDALVSPTRYEAYGLGVQEALCTGLPAFVSQEAGVAERYPLSLQELLLPDPNDAEDLARRLLAWREQPQTVAAEVLRLSQKLRGYTWDDMAKAMVAKMCENFS